VASENPFTSFAKSYGGDNSYLDAHVAISRCEQLLDDLDTLEAVAFDADPAKHHLPFFHFEIVSYYAVAFVTCLEWHARSRLVDSTAFSPGLITAESFQAISKQTLAAMMRENVTVHHVMGALLKISDLDEYSEVLKTKVLVPLGCHLDPRKMLETVSDEERAAVGFDKDENLLTLVTDLYWFRHHLVHEISILTAGPYTIRETISIGQARKFGRAVLVLMRLVERQITKFAPKHFPHVLDDKFEPVLEHETLLERIKTTEDRIERTLRERAEEDVLASWQETKAAERAAFEKQSQFIELAIPRLRYIDPIGEMQVLALRKKLEMLTALATEIGVPDPPED
jgi:hypothetical protein